MSLTVANDDQLLVWRDPKIAQWEAHVDFCQARIRDLAAYRAPQAKFAREFFKREITRARKIIAQATAAQPPVDAAREVLRVAVEEARALYNAPPAQTVNDEMRAQAATALADRKLAAARQAFVEAGLASVLREAAPGWVPLLYQAQQWAASLARLVHQHGADFEGRYSNAANDAVYLQARDVPLAQESADGFALAAMLVVGEVEFAGDRLAEKAFTARWEIIAKRLRLPETNERADAAAAEAS